MQAISPRKLHAKRHYKYCDLIQRHSRKKKMMTRNNQGKRGETTKPGTLLHFSALVQKSHQPCCVHCRSKKEPPVCSPTPTSTSPAAVARTGQILSMETRAGFALAWRWARAASQRLGSKLSCFPSISIPTPNTTLQGAPTAVCTDEAGL